MNTPAFSIVRSTQTEIEANMLIAFMRSEGFHPLDLLTSSHITLGGADISFHIQIPTAELNSAKEILRAYDESASASQAD